MTGLIIFTEERIRSSNLLKDKKMNDNSPVQPTLLRLKHILGDGSNAPIIPISKSAWWEGVKQGKYPQPIKIGSNTTVWRSDDIQQLVDKLCASENG